MDKWRSSVIFVFFLMNISCLNLVNFAFGTLDFVKSSRCFELENSVFNFVFQTHIPTQGYKLSFLAK